jgi:hypothetical protein
MRGINYNSNQASGPFQAKKVTERAVLCAVAKRYEANLLAFLFFTLLALGALKWLPNLQVLRARFGTDSSLNPPPPPPLDSIILQCV